MSDRGLPSTPAIGFSIETKFNASRTVVTQFHVPLGTDAKEVYKELTKVCEVVDRRQERELIKGLAITLERDTAEVEVKRNQIAGLEAAYKAEIDALVGEVTAMNASAERAWQTSERRGPFKLDGVVRSNIANKEQGIKNTKAQHDKNLTDQRTGLAALEDRIKKVKSEIAELEALQKAYE